MRLARARLSELQLALMLLTRLPAGQIAVVPAMGAAAWAFPLVGGVVGGLAATVLLAGLALGLAPTMAAGLALLAGVLATGGLHEDGLADVADGFGGGRDRARKLEIMRDSRIGSYGALALVLSLGLRWQGLAILAAHSGEAAAMALIALGAASRAGLALALAVMPAARSDGLGKAAAEVDAQRVGCALAIGLGALLAIGAPGAVLAMSVAGFALGLLALRQIGGQSGDVLGALQQVSEIAGWIVLSALV